MRSLDERWSTIDIVIGTAAIAAQRGWHETAAGILAAGTAWATTLGYGQIDHATSLASRTREQLRRTLDTASFARATERGAALSVEEAVALVQSTLEAIVQGSTMPAVVPPLVAALDGVKEATSE